MEEIGSFECFEVFFHKWENLPLEGSNKSKELPTLKAQDFSIFLSSFKEPLDRLNKSGTKANLWEVAGLKRDEVRISSTLNWFLDPLSEHGQGNKICIELLNIISEKSKEYPFVHAEFPHANDLNQYRAAVEVCPSGFENRVDVILDGKSLLLYIEVKIDAPQGNDQLKRYQALAKQHANGRKWGVVYLTLKGELPHDIISLENCIAIHWGDVAQAMKNASQTLDYGHISKHYIEQFAQYVANL